MQKIQNVILGAGIAGLSAANELDKKNTVVFEAESHAGGLCHSFEINGFCFDSAVHLSFTCIPEAKNYFDITPVITHAPTAYNFFQDLWIKHPILNNLFELPNEEKALLINDFATRNTNLKILNYKDWLLASYGEEFYKLFYDIYTQKYWTVKPQELSVNWVGERLAKPDLKKMLSGAFQKETGNDYYAKEMRYPTDGKYETFLNPLYKKANIKLNKKAIHINTEERMIKFQDGTSCLYENIISTIPLPKIVKILGEAVPQKVKDAVAKLKATQISLISVGISEPDIQPYLWFYIYDNEIMAARVNSPSIKSPNNVPKGCSSLQFEIYHNPDDKLPSDSEMIDNVKYAIKKMKICDEKDIMFMDYRLVPYGNVIFYLGMEENRKTVLDYLKEQGINVAGRFGEWDYLWSDQSFLSGKKAGKKISSEIGETDDR